MFPHRQLEPLLHDRLKIKRNSRVRQPGWYLCLLAHLKRMLRPPHGATHYEQEHKTSDDDAQFRALPQVILPPSNKRICLCRARTWKVELSAGLEPRQWLEWHLHSDIREEVLHLLFA